MPRCAAKGEPVRVRSLAAKLESCRVPDGPRCIVSNISLVLCLLMLAAACMAGVGGYSQVLGSLLGGSALVGFFGVWYQRHYAKTGP